MDLQKSIEKPKHTGSKLKMSLTASLTQRIAIGVALFFIIYSLVVTSIVPRQYNLSEGDIATDDIKSPMSAINEAETNKLRDEAVKKVKEAYVIDTTVRDLALQNVRDFFNKVFDIKSLQTIEDSPDKIERLKSESIITLADDDYEAAIKANLNDLKSLSNYMIENLNKILSEEISDNEEELKAKQDEFASNAKRNLKLSNELRNLAVDIGYALIKPNMIFDNKKTEEAVKEAQDSVTPVRIQKDQIIVRRGEVVTEEHLQILSSLGMLEEQNKVYVLLYIGIGILIALLEGIVIIYLFRFSPDILKDKGKLVLLSIITVLLLLITKFLSVYQVSGFIVPIAFASMLVAILIKPRLALILNSVLASLVTLMLGYNFDVFIVSLIGGSAGAIVVSRMHQRNDLITAGILVSFVNTLSILGIGLISSADIITVFKQSSLGILSGSLASIFTLGLLPFCESIFDIVTPIKLLELSNPNHPLLKKLLFEAPGTYHHSVLVGNLAEAATDAIDGNSLLARAGSYYHDIGKLKRPYFFKENQITNENPHDKITPSLSTLIITNHVKDGVELAKKYKLPTVIRDMVEQHHGTTLVKYFFVKAINDNESQSDIAENQFRYPGPKPRSKEAAVVMLADSVEAAVRAIPSPTKAKIEDVVRKIVKDKLDDGQLDESDLTLKDINNITEAFLKVLNGIYHDRIEYPDEVQGDKGGYNIESHGR
ncbi:7TM-HD extracellular [Oxobacter pfennigii]|uniref:7TM-HD extracellular n=1 Tax=Oxobacter pfennigii TaxID=36849 RepID=A0A0P8YAR6_9CLOT|nr:HDIG domain-containing metalloprotein [Oxobacter pfennigii]KPU44111.1 7TM-HD extracellular [Oxobacter pfennigii]